MEKGGDKDKHGALSGKSKPRRLLIKRGGSGKDRNRERNNSTEEINNSPPFQSKLQSLFVQIEKEFQKLHDENSERECYFMCSVLVCMVVTKKLSISILALLALNIVWNFVSVLGKSGKILILSI